VALEETKKAFSSRVHYINGSAAGRLADLSSFFELALGEIIPELPDAFEDESTTCP
jgi:hypothetical protein